MTKGEDTTARGADAETLFSEYLSRFRTGGAPGFEIWVAGHPTVESELRQAHSDYQRAVAGLDLVTTEGAAGTVYRGLRDGQNLGDFRLVRRLGRGGQGMVWEAEQVSLGRKVALKVVVPERVNEHTISLLEHEARAGGRLNHPGIVSVHGRGETEGIQWIAQELVPGGRTVRDLIDEARDGLELPAGYYLSVALLLADVADALEAAHVAGILHRDVKPLNILLTPDNKPKLTDFGLARVADETGFSISGEILGTYLYMSPEQIAGHRAGVDHRCDIFSLGVVLYELLALQRPFEGDTTTQIAHKIVNEEPPDILKLRSRMPRALAVIAGKALEKDRDKRYQSMAEFAADLRRFIDDEPILAKPPARWERAAKWIRRNPAKSGIAAVTVAAFTVISLLLSENIRANRDLTRTVGERDAEIESVKRLSALQDYDELIAEAGRLWPPHPENIEAYKTWIAEAQGLVRDLPLHRAKRQELGRSALPQAGREREADLTSHPEFSRLAALGDEIASHRAALLQRRDGVEAPLPELDWASLPGDARALNNRARPLVAPNRELFGREAEGLALARRALELARASAEDAIVAETANTLSWALFSLGRDEEALVAAGTSLAAAPEEERGVYQAHLTDLERWVEEAGGRQGFADAKTKLARMENELSTIEARVSERQVWGFPDTEEGREDRWWHANLTRLIESLAGLQDPETGLLSEEEAAVSKEHGWSVPRRLALAERLRDGIAEGGEWHARWQKAVEAIQTHSGYGGLALAAQVGLVPIGPDPVSGLWEFWHVATGMEPGRGDDGRLQLSEETGVVLVLIPGGSFWMGAQSEDPAGHNYDPQARDDERPVHEVELSPYFLAKHEMTQGQWKRVTGGNPSYFHESSLAPTLLHPVEQVSWLDCMAWLPRVGLGLPSEAQWERGCRGGADTVWWTGSERESLREKRAANLADQAAARAGLTWPEIEDWPELDDGYAFHAPAGTYTPNTFGLHEVAGNLWEWCLDGYELGFYRGGRSRHRDPVAPFEGVALRVSRGGSFDNAPFFARSATRDDLTPSDAVRNLGVRPARVIGPPRTRTGQPDKGGK